nr:DUF2059 domain-containing protein [Sphingomonas chungangi]
MEETAPQEPKFASIARKRPKEFESVLDAGQSAEAAILRREYPAGQRRIAAMFDRKLSIADLNALLAHFRSPLGRKLIAQGYSSIDREGMENPARFGLDRFFTRKERQQMAAFAKTSAARDFEAANLERHKIRIGWAQSLKSEIERDGNAGMDAALAQYNAHSGSAR